MNTATSNREQFTVYFERFIGKYLVYSLTWRKPVQTFDKHEDAARYATSNGRLVIGDRDKW